MILVITTDPDYHVVFLISKGKAKKLGGASSLDVALDIARTGSMLAAEK